MPTIWWRITKMIPDVKRPEMTKFQNVLWFVGMDPAVKVDNFGIVINGLFPKPTDGSEWNPFIREVFEIDHENFTEIISWINNKLLLYYPPRYGIIDATRDTPTSQEMEKKYGETRIKAMSMTNSINYELKQTAYAFLEQGYKWPNTATMQNKRKAQAIADLKVQTLHERVEWTADGRPKFTHPPNKHNDLNRAWEMSLKAVRDFQLGKVGNMDDTMYKGYDAEEIIDYEQPSGSFAMPYD